MIAPRLFWRRPRVGSSPILSLSPGSRLGPYEILAPIGAGGMGEVYKAKDTRLDRTVAIKVLPEKSMPSAEARQRFEREARTISQLSHPHICTLTTSDERARRRVPGHGAPRGRDAPGALMNGPLPLDQTLRYGPTSRTRSTGRTARASSIAT